jgi:hypothetical protein
MNNQRVVVCVLWVTEVALERHPNNARVMFLSRAQARNSEFPIMGYGLRVISITPGSRDFESPESRVRRGRNQP